MIAPGAEDFIVSAIAGLPLHLSVTEVRTRADPPLWIAKLGGFGDAAEVRVIDGARLVADIAPADPADPGDPVEVVEASATGADRQAAVRALAHLMRRIRRLDIFTDPADLARPPLTVGWTGNRLLAPIDEEVPNPGTEPDAPAHPPVPAGAGGSAAPGSPARGGLPAPPSRQQAETDARWLANACGKPRYDPSHGGDPLILTRADGDVELAYRAAMNSPAAELGQVKHDLVEVRARLLAYIAGGPA